MIDRTVHWDYLVLKAKQNKIGSKTLVEKTIETKNINKQLSRLEKYGSAIKALGGV